MVFIRADANEYIGMGHVMRCLSIAEQINKLNEQTVFIVADERARQMIEERGISVICLKSQWDDLEQEIPKLCAIIEQEHDAKILIDSYYVTEKYLAAIRKRAMTYYIDDLNDMIYPVDVLINYNIYGSDMDYEKKYSLSKTKLILGTEYVPLREAFSYPEKKRYKGVNKLLITSGGTDNFNILGTILNEFTSIEEFQSLEYYCVLGRFNINVNLLKERYGGVDNIHLLQNINNMDYYMKECDIAITAAGSTTYELCSCGTPSILYTIADNQLGIARAFSDQGIISWSGDVRDNMSECLENMREELKKLQNPEYWMQCSTRMQEVVDGNGAYRVAQEIINK